MSILKTILIAFVNRCAAGEKRADDRDGRDKPAMAK
jgi:hypothetical protein